MTTATHIETIQTEEGLYRATCPELGLIAIGSTVAEAEALVLRLINERTEQLGSPPKVVHSEHDGRVEPSDEDDQCS